MDLPCAGCTAGSVIIFVSKVLTCAWGCVAGEEQDMLPLKEQDMLPLKRIGICSLHVKIYGYML